MKRNACFTTNTNTASAASAFCNGACFSCAQDSAVLMMDAVAAASISVIVRIAHLLRLILGGSILAARALTQADA